MARSVSTATDSLDFFVQAQDSINPIITMATASTSVSYTSADQKNTLHRGAALFLNIASLSAAATIGVSIQGKDAVSGNYFLTGRASLDATQVTAGAQKIAVEFYPAMTTGGTASPFTANAMLTAIFNVVVSVVNGTAQTFSGTVGMSKVLSLAAFILSYPLFRLVT